MDPRRRILVTSILALVVALVVSLVVIGGQRSSGRAALTRRATEFVRLLKGTDDVLGRRLDFLRPEDRENSKLLAGIRRLEEVLGSGPSEIDVTEVQILSDGHGRSFMPGPDAMMPSRAPMRASLRQIDWIRGGDGRWYVDPSGL